MGRIDRLDQIYIEMIGRLSSIAAKSKKASKTFIFVFSLSGCEAYFWYLTHVETTFFGKSKWRLVQDGVIFGEKTIFLWAGLAIAN
jgi:hypothetical protein